MNSKRSRSILNSVTKKQVMGVTGLLLCGFLVSHLLGNLLLFAGSDAFNKYSYTLTSNPLIYVAEVGLLALFVAHIAMAFKLVYENNKARPVAYYKREVSGKGSTFASSTMAYTGLIALVFLVIHIMGLKFGTHYTTTVGNIEMRDMYRTTIEYFQDPLHILFYIFAVASLGIHTSHGFWSAFQSLGFNHPKYNKKLRLASYAFGLVIGVGFAALPVFCYFKGAN